MVNINHCLASIAHHFVTSLPDIAAPHNIYFLLEDDKVYMYVADANGTLYLIGGGGGEILITSPNGTITITDGTNIDVSQNILDRIISLHNEFPDLQGGSLGEFYHLTAAQYNYVVEIVETDAIGAINNALNNLAVPPTYTLPTSSLNNVTATYEVGSSQSINLTQTYIQNDGGAKTSEIITKNGSTVSNTNTYNESLTVPLGSTVYAGQVNYAQGACKNNNLGLPDCTGRVVAGTTTSPNRTVTGIYPVFYYKSNSPITAASMQSAINSGLASKLVISSTGTISVPYAPNAEYLGVAYVAASPTKTKWMVNVLDAGDIPGGVFNAQTTLPVNSPDGLWSSINYKIHVTPLITNPTAPTIQLLNS